MVVKAGCGTLGLPLLVSELCPRRVSSMIMASCETGQLDTQAVKVVRGILYFHVPVLQEYAIDHMALPSAAREFHHELCVPGSISRLFTRSEFPKHDIPKMSYRHALEVQRGGFPPYTDRDIALMLYSVASAE